MAYDRNKGGAKKEQRRIVFHSELAGMGPVRVTVDDNPRYLKNKQRDVVELTLNGEKILYWCENEGCAQTFADQKGQTFTIIAEGNKDEATVTNVGAAAAPPAEPPPATRQSTPSRSPAPTRQATPAGSSEANIVKTTRVFAARRLQLLKICTKAMMTFKDEAEASGAPPMDSTTFWSRVTSLYISCEAEGLAMRAGFADALPVNLDFATLLPVHKNGSPTTQKPAAAPPPPPPPTPVCDACGSELKEDSTCSNAACEKCTDDVPF